VSHQGKIQLTFVIVSPPQLADEGERLFRTHAPWMKATHHREGNKALLSYSVSKGPELANPMDPSSPPTGRVCFVLTEVYETAAGVADHFEQAQSGWKEFPAVVEWMGKCTVTGIPAAPIMNSLW
jgi:hypothetical protein